MNPQIKYEIKNLKVPIFPTLLVSDFIPTIFISEDNASSVYQVLIEKFNHEDLTETLNLALSADKTCLYINGSITLNDHQREGLILELKYYFVFFQDSEATAQPYILGTEIFKSDNQFTYKPSIEVKNQLTDIIDKMQLFLL